jgi:hypothetical protein
VGVQVVGYETVAGDGPAALLVAEEGDVVREPLASGTTLEFALGDRHCAGALTGEGHVACDVETAPYCEAHTSRWACARCRGDCGKPLEACDEEHAVYLAAFAPATCKVGVTRSWRLDIRLREQGADRAAHARTVADGRIARRLEADWAVELTDRVRVPEKIRGLHEPVDEAAWRDLLAEFTVEATYEFDYGLDLAARPVAETIATGTVRGSKGRILVVDRGGTTYAVDMRDLVGHELSPGGTDRDLQSSLGSFRA